MNIKRWTKDQLVFSLKKEGLVFTDFTLCHEGQYTIDDADWNYKDVPHLHYIHKLVEANFAIMSDEVINTINTQKILGLTVPLAVVNYQSGKDEQTYYTCLLFFVLIVHTRYEAVDSTHTRVITNYNIGGPWLLKWCFPIIKWLIKRNYDDLMSGDIPMRARRGELRAKGYQFHKDNESHSFIKTTEILKDNITPSADHNQLSVQAVNIGEILPGNGEVYLGQDDHLGLRMVRQGDTLMVFGRMCMHEGASLDKSGCENGKLKCPWHGRLHAPLAAFQLGNHVIQEHTSKYFIFRLDGMCNLSIKYIDPISCSELESMLACDGART